MSNVTDTGFASIKYLDTGTAYDLWSEVYDTDGNFLQALDSIEMKTLLPQMISAIKTPRPWHIVDLGCGTGRNTLLLLQYDDVHITALDLSPKMLNVARARTQEQLQKSSTTTTTTNATIGFQVFDMLAENDIPAVAENANAVVSTLVLEHIPLQDYFSTVVKFLKPGGLLLLTNMHSDMGQISQAGFVDPKTKQKIRPTSYAHTTQAVIEAASTHRLELVGELHERSVTAETAAQLGSRGQKWIGVTVWFGGIFKLK